jgi:hypothetical protein
MVIRNFQINPHESHVLLAHLLYEIYYDTVSYLKFEASPVGTDIYLVGTFHCPFLQVRRCPVKTIMFMKAENLKQK